MVKNQPAMQETQVPSLGQEHPLEKETATQSSIFAWGFSWMEEPGGLQSTRSQKRRTQLSNEHKVPLEHVFGKCYLSPFMLTKEVTDMEVQAFFIQTTPTTSPVL